MGLFRFILASVGMFVFMLLTITSLELEEYFTLIFFSLLFFICSYYATKDIIKMMNDTVDNSQEKVE